MSAWLSSPGVLPLSSLAQYLHLLARLLSHMTRKGRGMPGALEVELDGDDMQERASDVLGSPEELLACCVATLLGEELPARIRLERSVGNTLSLAIIATTCYKTAVVPL